MDLSVISISFSAVIANGVNLANTNRFVIERSESLLVTLGDPFIFKS